MNVNINNIINKKENLKNIVEKYLQLQLLIKNFSMNDVGENFNKEIFDISLSEIRLKFNKCISNLNESELKELITYFTEEYSKIKDEVSKEQNNINFINSDDLFERIDNLEKYNSLRIEYNNKRFRCSFYYETIKRLQYHLALKNKDTEQPSKII